MRPQLPAFFRRLDQHLLESFPVLWILRLHYVLAVWLLGLALLVGLALALPIRISTVLPFERPYWPILGAIALLAAPWAYRLARLSPALRHDPRPRTGVLLLAAYLGFSTLFLLWPIAFYRIFEQRIADAVTPTDDALLLRAWNARVIALEAEPLLRRFGLSSAPNDPPTLTIRGERKVSFSDQADDFLSVLYVLKHPTPDSLSFLRMQRTPGVFWNPDWAAAFVLFVLWGRVAQIVRREHFLGFLATLLALALASATRLAPRYLAVVLLAYIATGAVATFWSVGDRRNVNMLITHLAAVFYFLLPCSVLFAKNAGLVGAPPSSTEAAFRALALGLVLLFALAPFIEGRLVSLAAAPS